MPASDDSNRHSRDAVLLHHRRDGCSDDGANPGLCILRRMGFGQRQNGQAQARDRRAGNMKSHRRFVPYSATDINNILADLAVGLSMAWITGLPRPDKRQYLASHIRKIRA
jgi:hypothetical protein